MSLILYSTMTGRSRAMLRVTVPAEHTQGMRSQSSARKPAGRALTAASCFSTLRFALWCAQSVTHVSMELQGMQCVQTPAPSYSLDRGVALAKLLR